MKAYAGGVLAVVVALATVVTFANATIPISEFNFISCLSFSTFQNRTVCSACQFMHNADGCGICEGLVAGDPEAAAAPIPMAEKKVREYECAACLLMQRNWKLSATRLMAWYCRTFDADADTLVCNSCAQTQTLFIADPDEVCTNELLDLCPDFGPSPESEPPSSPPPV